MRTHRLTGTVIFMMAFWTFTTLSAQSVDQWLVGASASGMNFTQGMVACTDGSTYVHELQDTGSVFTRVGSTGIAEWTRLLASISAPGIGAPPLASTIDGALTTVIGKSFQGGAVHLDLVKVDEFGSSVWSKRISIPSGVDMSAPFGLVSGPAGAYFLLGRVSDGNAIVKLDPNGDPLWCSRIYDALPSSHLDILVSVVPTSDGGCVFLGEKWPSAFGAGVVLGRLNDQGALLWCKDVVYNAASVVQGDMAMCIDGNDVVTVVTRLDLLGVSNSLITYRLSASGGWLDTDLYSVTGVIPGLPKVVQRSPGSLDIMARTTQDMASMLVSVDTAGLVQEALVTDRDTVADEVGEVNFWPLSVVNGSLHLAGDLVKHHVIFGTEERTTLLWRADGSLANACYVSPITVQHNDVPQGLVTLSDVGSCTPVTAISTATTMVNNVLPIQLTASLCATLGGMDHSEPGRCSVFPNPASDGMRVELSLPGPWTVHLVNMTGSRVRLERVPGPVASFSVRGLPTGVYTVVAINDREERLMTRLMVE